MLNYQRVHHATIFYYSSAPTGSNWIQLDPTGVSILYYTVTSHRFATGMCQNGAMMGRIWEDTMQEELVATMGREFT